MSIRANITLTDAAGTPVNHVFSPTQGKDDRIHFQDRTITGVYIGQGRVALAQRLASKTVKTNKFVLTLETPVLEQTSPSTSTGIQPAPVVSYTPLAEATFVLPDRMTLQERKDLLAQFRDLLSDTMVTDLVQDLNTVW